MSEKRSVEMEYNKSTKNKHRYQEVESDQPPITGSMYIEKYVLGSNPPERLTLTLEW